MKTWRRRTGGGWRGMRLGAALFAVCLLPAAAPAASVDPVRWTGLLQAHVDPEGWVDYRGLKERGGASVQAILRDLAERAPLPDDPGERTALYINAYNLFTLALIVEHYPVASIRKIPGVSGLTGTGQWKKKLWTFNGEAVSLDEIEHGWLRPMGDPRIHFALVCAARGCPPLARNAYSAENLDRMLDEQGRRFSRLPRGLRTGMERGWRGERPVLWLSSIYDWFKGDFLRVSPDLPAYVTPFASQPDRVFIETHREDLKVRFLDYDWSLNEQP